MTFDFPTLTLTFDDEIRPKLVQSRLMVRTELREFQKNVILVKIIIEIINLCQLLLLFPPPKKLALKKQIRRWLSLFVGFLFKTKNAHLILQCWVILLKQPPSIDKDRKHLFTLRGFEESCTKKIG